MLLVADIRAYPQIANQLAAQCEGAGKSRRDVSTHRILETYKYAQQCLEAVNQHMDCSYSGDSDPTTRTYQDDAEVVDPSPSGSLQQRLGLALRGRLRPRRVRAADLCTKAPPQIHRVAWSCQVSMALSRRSSRGSASISISRSEVWISTPWVAHGPAIDMEVCSQDRINLAIRGGSQHEIYRGGSTARSE